MHKCEIVVAVPENGLQMTEHGLMLATLKIPIAIRRNFDTVSYSWAGRAEDEKGNKWLLIKVSWNPLPHADDAPDAKVPHPQKFLG